MLKLLTAAVLVLASAAAALGGTVSIPTNLTAPQGAVITVPVIAANAPPGARSFDLDIQYDPRVLQVIGARSGEITQGLTITENLRPEWRYRAAVWGTIPFSALNGELLKIDFRVVGPVGAKTPLNVERALINERRQVRQAGAFTVAPDPPVNLGP